MGIRQYLESSLLCFLLPYYMGNNYLNIFVALLSCFRIVLLMRPAGVTLNCFLETKYTHRPQMRPNCKLVCWVFCLLYSDMLSRNPCYFRTS
jgi:hypothetical protein